MILYKKVLTFDNNKIKLTSLYKKNMLALTLVEHDNEPISTYLTDEEAKELRDVLIKYYGG